MFVLTFELFIRSTFGGVWVSVWVSIFFFFLYTILRCILVVAVKMDHFLFIYCRFVKIATVTAVRISIDEAHTLCMHICLYHHTVCLYVVYMLLFFICVFLFWLLRLYNSMKIVHLLHFQIGIFNIGRLHLTNFWNKKKTKPRRNWAKNEFSLDFFSFVIGKTNGSFLCEFQLWMAIYRINKWLTYRC